MIPLLIEHFLHSPAPRGWRLTDSAKRALCNYSWPGNVRELANVIERAKILADDTLIDLDHLPEVILDPAESELEASSEQSALTAEDDLSVRERGHVAAVLERENGNKARAAKTLGISRRSLYRLIEKYGLKPRRRGGGDN
jgi:DNA-binding NtrC family response regulator